MANPGGQHDVGPGGASPAAPPPASAAPAPGEKIYHCGTLAYTRRGLFLLFSWLLWGDFCFTLMSAIVPSVVPLKFKALGASNLLMSVVLTTLPAILNMTVCPWVSFKSDRHRGRWGRRTPYIVVTMPFLALSLILLGWSDWLTPFMQGIIPWLASLAPATVTIGLIALFLVLFVFFDMFVGSVYWYLFNDVVPPQFLGRFMGLFRLVGAGASALFNFFIFGHAETHFREIFTGIAILYVLGFSIMFLFVKEGKYEPPPPPAVQGNSWRDIWGFLVPFGAKALARWRSYSLCRQALLAVVLASPALLLLSAVAVLAWAFAVAYGVERVVKLVVPRGLRRRAAEPPEAAPPGSKVSAAFAGFAGQMMTFGKQSFSHQFYWYFYLKDVFGAIGGSALIFTVFFNKEMGLTVEQIGEIAGWVGLAHLASTYFVSVFVDRWHPMRISAYNAVFGAVMGWSVGVWVFVTVPGNVFYWLSLLGGLVITFGATLQEACSIPLFMRVMPKSLYGQLSSANAMLRSGARIIAGLVVGGFMDLLMWLCNGSNFAYRLLFIWGWVFTIGATVCVCMCYREWQRLGGDESYRPPAPWLKEGVEEVIDKVKSVPARPRLVMVSMWLGLAGAAVNLLLVMVFMYFMWQGGMQRSLLWYAEIFIPIKLVLTGLNYWQVVAVRRDIRASEAGRPIKYGIPHHGVLLVNAIQALLAFPVFWYQTIQMIELTYDSALIVFGIASLGTTAMAMVGVHILRWIERAQPELA